MGRWVLLHALEQGQVPPQVSQDGDVVADLRASPGAIAAAVAALEAAQFEVDGMSPDGLAHRYVRPATPTPVKVDVLAPDGLGPRADLTTTSPGRTLEMAGGTQALERTELVDVVHEGRRGAVPRPSLLAALVGKGAACALPGDSSRHVRDLAMLCTVVPDPFTLREQLRKKDRQRLLSGAALLDTAHVAWQLVSRDIREQGQETYVILTASR